MRSGGIESETYWTSLHSKISACRSSIALYGLTDSSRDDTMHAFLKVQPRLRSITGAVIGTCAGSAPRIPETDELAESSRDETNGRCDGGARGLMSSS
jgi:hypothetical protein